MPIALEKETEKWARENMGVTDEMRILGVKTPQEAAKILEKRDLVKAPSHYADRKYQTILVLQDTLTSEEFLGFLKGNAMKYMSRAGKKDATIQEMNKAKVYLQWAIEFEEHGELQDVPVY